MPNEMIDAGKVKAEMEQMIDMISHPAFVDAMKQLKESPVSKRQELGKSILTIDALRKAGIDVPPEMRLTTRYFEPGKPDIIEVSPGGVIKKTKQPLVPIGKVGSPGGEPAWGGCACGGGLTFCGGAGGGT